jgi:tetratricopeptide (TPR) repeat protein
MRRNLAICFCLVLMTLAAYWQVWGPPLYHHERDIHGWGSLPKPVASLVSAVHLPTQELEYVYFDDPGYVTDNPRVQKGLCWESICWAFTTGEQSNWHPLTWLSHMLDIEMFGFRQVGQPNPVGPHIVNLLLHLGNTLLLFFLLRWMTGATWRSAVVAALFAVHPMHVESVAWVAERKDVLSTFLGLLTLAAYLWYVQRLKAMRHLPWADRILPGVVCYLPIMVLYTLCLLAKPMLVTLPCLLLLLDYWPLGRLKLRAMLNRPHQLPQKRPEISRAAKARLDRLNPALRREAREVAAVKTWELRWATAGWLMLEKLPLLVLAGLSCVMTYHAQQKGGSMATQAFLPLFLRVNNALTAYVRYIGGMFWPFKLAAFYPYTTEPNRAYLLAAWTLLMLLSIAAIVGAVYGRRYLFVGWFWYVGMLVPVIGFVQVGDQSMADRYSYFTFTGLFIAIVWGLTDLFGRWEAGRVALAGLAAAALACCVALTLPQVSHWQDSETAFVCTLAVAPDNPAFQNNWGVLNWERAMGKREPRAKNEDEARHYRDEAIKHWREAVRIRPRFSDALNNLGCALRYRDEGTSTAAYHKQLEEAVECFRAAIEYKAEHADAHSNLALTLMELKGPQEEVLEHFHAALALRPDHLDAHISLAVFLRQLGDLAQQRGDAAKAGDYFSEAAQHLEYVVHLDPNQKPHAWTQLGLTRLAQGRRNEAAADLNTGAWIMATSPLHDLRNGPIAMSLAGQAAHITGEKEPRILDTLAAACAEAGRFQDAVRVATKAALLAAQQDDTALADAIRGRIAGYHNGLAFTDEQPISKAENGGK